MPTEAMSLVGLRTIAGGMANSADRFDIVMMLWSIAFVVVVFVASFAFFPDMAAVNTRQRIRMWPISCFHLNIDSLPRLLFITISRRRWQWPRLAYRYRGHQ